MVDIPRPLDVPLGGGLAEGIDPKLLPFGAAAALTNYEVVRAGALTKRRGFGGELGVLEVGIDDYPLGSVCRLFSAEAGAGAQQALLATADDFTDTLPHAYAYAESLGRWADVDTVSPCATRRDPVVRVNKDGDGGSALVFGASGKSFALAVIVMFDATLTPFLFYRVVDRLSGAVVVREVALGSISTVALAAAGTVSGGHAWIFYDDSGGLKALKIDGSDPTVTSSVTLDATATGFMCAADKLNASRLVVCWRKATASSTLQMCTLNASTGAVVDTASLVATGAITALECTGSSEWGTAFAWISGDIYAEFRSSALVAGLGAFTVESGLTSVNDGEVGLEFDALGALWVTYEGEVNTGDRAALARYCSTAGTPSDRHIAYRASWASSPQLIGGRVWGLLSVPQQGDLDSAYRLESGPAHFALTCIDDQTGDRALLLEGHPVTTIAKFGGPGCKLWPSDSSEKIWHVGLSTVTSDAPGYNDDTAGVDLVTLDFTTPQAKLHASAQAAPLLLLGGVLTQSIDQHQAVESGFLQAPKIASHTTALVAGALASAPSPGLTYLYRCRYEWTDDTGQLHVSPWSDDHSVNLTNASSLPYQVTLTILCTSLTRRGRPDFGEGRDAQIAIYRSTANGASAAGDVVFYRLLAFGDSDAPLNSRMDWSVDFEDAIPDATLIASGFGQVVTPGDVLAPICPPASADLMVHRGRAWLLSAEDRREVWPSRLLVPGEAPAFCSELVQRLSDSPTEIEGLLGVDDKVVMLCTDRIYYLAGDGPDDTGQVGGFLGPWLVTAQHGCVDRRSIVQIPMGGIFLAGPGFLLLDRALGLQFVGEPVQSTTEVYSTCIASHHDPARNRAVWMMANADSETVLLVYDYEHQVWSKLDTAIDGDLRALALWRGDQVIAFDRSSEGETLHFLRREGAGAQPGWDLDEDGAAAWVTGVYETPWICPGGPGAYQRVRGTFLLGEKLSACRMQLELFTNFDATTAIDTKVVNLGAGSTIAGLPLVRYVWPTEVQACEAIKIRVTDLEPDAAGEDAAERAGLALTRMALELGPERGFPRLPATNRGGS